MVIVISKYRSVHLSLAECSNMFRLELDGMSEFNQNQTFNQVMDRF